MPYQEQKKRTCFHIPKPSETHQGLQLQTELLDNLGIGIVDLLSFLSRDRLVNRLKGTALVKGPNTKQRQRAKPQKRLTVVSGADMQ